MSVLAVRVCRVARMINLLLDPGYDLDPLEVRRHVLDEDLLPWLDRRFPQHNPCLSTMATIDQAELHERFLDLALARVEQRYGVHSNGLCVLIAYCVEVMQALELSGQ